MWCCVWLFLVVSTSAIDCLERLVSDMTYYVSSGTLNPTHSLTHTGIGLYWLTDRIIDQEVGGPEHKGVWRRGGGVWGTYVIRLWIFYLAYLHTSYAVNLSAIHLVIPNYCCCCRFLARDAFVRTNLYAIAMMFVRLSVCLSVCLGRACIVIIRCTLARV